MIVDRAQKTQDSGRGTAGMNTVDISRGVHAFTITWDDRSIAELPFIWLRDNDPNELHPDTRERVFDLTAVPWRFHDDNNDIRRRRPLITEANAGELDYFVFNAHIADLPDMDARSLYAFYPAYQRLMARLRRPVYAIEHALLPGEMVIFDNTRVLHGRMAFDAGSGERHLCGYYLERNEVDSRLRVLARDNNVAISGA